MRRYELALDDLPPRERAHVHKRAVKEPYAKCCPMDTSQHCPFCGNKLRKKRLVGV